MPLSQESSLITVDPERYQAVAAWLREKIHPVLGAAQGDQVELEERDYQIEALVKLADARSVGQTRALGNLATGLGKTFIAAADVRQYMEECAASGRQPRFLYASHRHEINWQAAATFRAVMPDIDIEFFKTRRAKLPEAELVFAALRGLYSELDRFDPGRFDYIVWDEGHHLEAETYMAVRDHFRPRFEHALTATVLRMDRKDIMLYFGRPLYRKSLAEGITEGWLADVDYRIVLDKTVQEKLIDGFEPKTLGDIKRLLNNRPPVEELAKSVREESARLGLQNPKTIVFCSSIAESKEVARLLNGVAYHSGSKTMQPLDDFKNGAVRIIATPDKLNEGVNVRDVELLVFYRGTGSPSIFAQQLGRGLRKTAGKRRVAVLDYVANIERIIRIRALGGEVQQYAGSQGQAGVRDADVGAGGSIRITTAHGSFDFDTLVVDLLAKWDTLRQNELLSYTNEELVELALSLKSEGPLSTSEVRALCREGEFLSVTAIRLRFGSFPGFQRECGFEPNEPPITNPSTMTREEIRALALKLSPDAPLSEPLINSLSRDGEFVSQKRIIKLFTSIPEFQVACGFTPNQRRRKSTLTNDQMVIMALELSPGKPLGEREINALSKQRVFVSSSLIARRFGSIPDFQMACGFEPTRKSPRKKDDIPADDPPKSGSVRKSEPRRRSSGKDRPVRPTTQTPESVRATGLQSTVANPFGPNPEGSATDPERVRRPVTPVTFSNGPS